MTCDFPGKYNQWDKVDPVGKSCLIQGKIGQIKRFFQAELFSCPIERKEANPKLKMPAFLASEVIWLIAREELMISHLMCL